jgi:hypothetical protein
MIRILLLRASAPRSLHRLADDERGVIAVVAAFALTMLMGFAGLAIDVAYWQSVQRKMQASADQAAYSAAMDTSGRGSNIAKAVAAGTGYVDGQNGIHVTVNNPPATGSYSSNNLAWETIITQSQPMWFAGLFLATSPTVKGRSVALGNAVGAANACLLALNTTAANAIQVANNATLPSTTCGVAANSNSASAINLGNNATIAGPVNTVGQWTLANNASLTGSPQDKNSTPIADPYASLALPSTMPSCTPQLPSTSSPTPAYFCSGWSFTNNEAVTLAAGTYYIRGGITVGNNATIDGSAGVTIVITDGSAITFNNNDTVTLTAPSTASGQPYPGIAIMDLDTTNVTHTISNNVTMTIRGALYFPHHKLNFTNNADVTNTGCTQIIADTIQLAENVNVNSNCGTVGIIPMTFGGKPKVEE